MVMPSQPGCLCFLPELSRGFLPGSQRLPGNQRGTDAPKRLEGFPTARPDLWGEWPEDRFHTDTGEPSRLRKGGHQHPETESGGGGVTAAAPACGPSPSGPPGEGCPECSFGMPGRREGPKFLSMKTYPMKHLLCMKRGLNVSHQTRGCFSVGQRPPCCLRTLQSTKKRQMSLCWSN